MPPPPHDVREEKQSVQLQKFDCFTSMVEKKADMMIHNKQQHSTKSTSCQQ